MSLDPEQIRRAFPIFERETREGHRLAYLDNAATTQKPAAVIDAVAEFYRRDNANVHRALHELGERATASYEGARKTVADFIGAESERHVVFTRGTTESINMVAHGWGNRFVKSGDEIIATEMEHHSNLLPWQALSERTGAVLRFIPVDDQGVLDMEALRDHLCPRTRLVAVTHVSNVLGTVNPVAEITAAAHEVGARVVVDAAQSVPHMSLDMQAIGCDFLAFSGHKMLGPTGSGALCMRSEVLEEMEPFLLGGEMISEVHFLHATWAEPPQRFEAGTPNVAGAVGLAAAIGYLNDLGMENVRAHEAQLTGYALERLANLGGVRVFGAAPERCGIVSFEVDGVHPHDMAQFVDQEGVALRAGHMCAQPLLRKFGIPSITRASFYVYNTREDIDTLVEAIQEAQTFFGGD